MCLCLWCCVCVVCAILWGRFFLFFGALGLLFWFWLFYFLDLAILGGGGVGELFFFCRSFSFGFF